MIPLPGGWAQWDYQIDTFRAEVNGQVIGNYAGEIPTVEALEALVLSVLGVQLTPQDISDLIALKVAAEQ